MLHARSLVIGVVLGLGVCVGPLYCREQAQSAALAAARDTVAAARAVVRVRVESVTVFRPVVEAAKAESDRLADLVTVVGPATLEVRTTPSAEPSLVAVPPVVAQLIQAQGRTIAEQDELILRQDSALVAKDRLIAAQDTLIARHEAARPSRCGPKCGGAIVLGGLALVKLALALF